MGNACLDVYFCLLACCLLAVLFTLTSSLSVLEILNILRFKIHEFYHMVCQKQSRPNLPVTPGSKIFDVATFIVPIERWKIM